MPDTPVALTMPRWLTADHRRSLEQLARRRDTDHGANLLGLVLTGSVARDTFTECSDLDVYVVLGDADPDRPPTTGSRGVDEIPVTLHALDQPPGYGTLGWWHRWSFAWAPVLLDRTDGQLSGALRRQATVTAGEARSILVDHDRLDGWLNLAYRQVKSVRDGRAWEGQLDAAESLPWLLDVVFSLEGRVRPYNTYLPWELRQHPLPHWPTDELLALLRATLSGDPSATRRLFELVEARCALFDQEWGAPVLTPIMDDWGDTLRLLRP